MVSIFTRNNDLQKELGESMSDEQQKVSTSQLAKRAGIESRKLFDCLHQAKWISRNESDDGSSKWELTAKGEFEGGEYFNSEKYGLGPVMLTQKATVKQAVVVLFFVAAAFLLCIGSKTLVGFLFVVPFLFLLLGIPWVVQFWITRLKRRSSQDGKPE